jgi:hypothetical protein
MIRMFLTAISFTLIGSSAIPATISSEEFFYRLGVSQRCYFTFEFLSAREKGRRFQDVRVDERLLSQAETNLVTAVRRIFPEYVLMNSHEKSNVWHLIESELLKTTNYAANINITLSFTGWLGSARAPGLVAEMAKMQDSIATRAGGLYDEVFDDSSTRISISVTNKSMRDTLTLAVPLEVYGPLLWRAETSRAGGNPRTIVQYFGRNASRGKRR